MKPLGGCFWGLLGLFFGPLKGLGLVGGLWGVLEASRGPLGASPSLSWANLGPVLGPSWAVLGAFWAVLKTPLGPSWGGPGGLLGRLGAVLGASWAVLERWKLENARTFLFF